MARVNDPAASPESGITLAPPTQSGPSEATPATPVQAAVAPEAAAPVLSAPVVAPVPARPAKWRKVHHARLVTLPDGSEKPQGAIFDASGFDRDLLAHYEEEGYLLPSDPPEIEE